MRKIIIGTLLFFLILNITSLSYSAKESLWGIDQNEIFRETFTSEADSVRNGGTVTGSPSFSYGEADFTSGDSDKITYLDITGVKSIVFEITLDTTTESILDFDGSTATVTAATGTVTIGAGIDTPTVYVNGAATATITTSKALVAITTATAFNATAFDVGSGLDGKLDSLRLFNVELTAKDVELLYENSLYKNNRDGLVGEWRLDRVSSSGTTIYDMAGSNNGTITAGASDGFVTDRLGRVGKAYDFDGSATVIELDGTATGGANPLELDDDFTISMWANAQESKSSYVINNYLGTSAYAGQFINIDANVQGSGIDYRIYTDDNVNPSEAISGEVSLNEWHHIVAVRDKGSTLKIYVDGVESDSTADITTGSILSNKDWVIGKNSDSAVEYFNGSISNVRIYNRVLSLTEITQRYEREFKRVNRL